LVAPAVGIDELSLAFFATLAVAVFHSQNTSEAFGLDVSE
jgi:hypothetical protein